MSKLNPDVTCGQSFSERRSYEWRSERERERNQIHDPAAWAKIRAHFLRSLDISKSVISTIFSSKISASKNLVSFE